MADRRALRRAGLLVLLLAFVISFAGAFQHGLWTPDEPREAEIGREMLASRFSAMPTLADAPFLEKPPLGAWTAAAAYASFGVNDWAARVPAALFAVGAIWIAYLMGRRAGGRLAGLCTAIVLATTWQFSETAHKGMLDVQLAFFVAAGHLAFLRLRTSNSIANYVVVFVCAGLAFMTKSVIGPALMCAPPILAAAAMRDGPYVKRVLPRAFVAATAGVVLFGLPWVLALAHTEGGGWPAVKTCLVTNTIGRSVGGGRDGYGFSGHDHWFGYYLVAVWSAAAPWFFAWPAAFVGGTATRARCAGRATFCGLVFVAGLLLLSIPSGKRELYLLPLLPAASVVAGVWLSRADVRRAWDRNTLRVLSGVALLAFLATTGAMAYVALGLPLPKSTDAFTRDALVAEQRTVLIAMVGAGLLILGPRLWAKRKLIPAGAAGLHVAASLFTVFLILHLIAFPLLAPLRDMDRVREAAALVPERESIVALNPDETTRAIVPFYTGRKFVAAVTAKQALDAIDAGATRLLVQDKDREKLAPRINIGTRDRPEFAPPLAERLSLVKSVQVNATRVIDVYEVRPK